MGSTRLLFPLKQINLLRFPSGARIHHCSAGPRARGAATRRKVRQKPGEQVGGVCLVDVHGTGWCLLAVVLLDFEVRVEVEDNLLVGFGGINNPLTVLVGWIILGVPRGGDIASVFGIQTTSTGLVWKRRHTKQRTSNMLQSGFFFFFLSLFLLSTSG